MYESKRAEGTTWRWCPAKCAMPEKQGSSLKPRGRRGNCDISELYWMYNIWYNHICYFIYYIILLYNYAFLYITDSFYIIYYYIYIYILITHFLSLFL